jgi:23S rRNA pseudouridine1911/1915/1917 synthase
MVEEVLTFIVAGTESQRLDKFLVTCLPDFSRSRLQGLIDDGLVTINGVTARKAGVMVEAPASVQIRIPPPMPTSIKPQAIPLEIIYENENLLVVNKPAGMVVHPAAGHASGTLVNAALAHDPNIEGIGGEQRPGVVHRLDKDTSGLILLAKTDRTQRFLQDQFRQRKIRKTYIALVDGAPPTPTGRIEAAIGRDPRDRKRMAIVPPHKGREATSEYQAMETFLAHTLLEVHPITGRTHQIRLHLAYIGCPVVGDSVYGRRTSSLALDRHFLHAFRLVVYLPGERQPHTFEAPLPAALENILAQLRHR